MGKLGPAQPVTDDTTMYGILRPIGMLHSVEVHSVPHVLIVVPLKACAWLLFCQRSANDLPTANDWNVLVSQKPLPSHDSEQIPHGYDKLRKLLDWLHPS